MVDNPQPLFITRHPLPQINFEFTENINNIQPPYAYQETTNLNPDTLYDLKDKFAIPNPYIATIREVVYSRPEDDSSLQNQRLFDILFESDCLPSERKCQKCLGSYSPTKGSCANCSDVCKCYCQALCKYRPPEPFISKDYWVRVPLYRKDPERIIPRIIHQVSSDRLELQKESLLSLHSSNTLCFFFDKDLV